MYRVNILPASINANKSTQLFKALRAPATEGFTARRKFYEAFVGGRRPSALDRETEPHLTPESKRSSFGGRVDACHVSSTYSRRLNTYAL